jgi:hypothetical protein
VGGATLNLCGDCISAGINDSFYNETNYEEDLLDNKSEEEILGDDFLDEPNPDELDDIDQN